MQKAIFYLLFLSSACYGQSYEQLATYSSFYKKRLDSFVDFMKVAPTVSNSNNGIRQMVYEMDGFHIGIEEHPVNNGIIGEMFIFQTESTDPHSDWINVHNQIRKDKSFRFVKAMYNDDNVKHNDIALNQLQMLLKNKEKNKTPKYGVRYEKNLAYYSLAIIDGNMIFTIDDKNY